MLRTMTEDEVMAVDGGLVILPIMPTSILRWVRKLFK